MQTGRQTQNLAAVDSMLITLVCQSCSYQDQVTKNLHLSSMLVEKDRMSAVSPLFMLRMAL